jgi:hypothetical protein
MRSTRSGSALGTRVRGSHPDLERMYATRAHSHTIEIEGASHSVYESHAKEVAALIEDAVRHALDGNETAFQEAVLSRTLPGRREGQRWI